MKFDNKTQDKTETRKQTRKNKNTPIYWSRMIYKPQFSLKKWKINVLIFLCYSVNVVVKCLICSETRRNVNWRLMKFCRDVMCTWPLNAESRSDLTSLRYCMMQSYLQYCEKYILDTLKENKHARSICSHILITWLIDHMISQLSWLWLFVKLKKTILLSALIKISPWSPTMGVCWVQYRGHNGLVQGSQFVKGRQLRR